jgi:hypothetical protein
MMINVKQCMMQEVFFCISLVAPEKSLGTNALGEPSAFRAPPPPSPIGHIAYHTAHTSTICI